MKKILLAAAALCMLFTACRKDQDITPLMVDVQVSFPGLDITVTPADTKSGSESTVSQAGVKRIALSVYDLSGNLIADTIKNKDVDAATFGNPITMRLPVGSYKFVAVAHGVANSADPVATINSATEVSFGTMIVANPTYTTVQDVTISGNTTQAVAVDFGTRKNSTFAVRITDDSPADVKSIQLIVSPASNAYTDLLVNPSTGFTATQYKYSKTFNLAALGITNINSGVFNLPVILTSASQQLDVTINALDQDGTAIYTRTLQNVPLQQAHRTLATGTFFSPEVTSTFTFDISEITDNISLD